MYAKFSTRDKKFEKYIHFFKKVYFSSRMPILHIQLYIPILSRSLCSATFKLCEMSMFVSSWYMFRFYLFFSGTLF